ncbi:hypothetical protein [Vreelandella sulfidaeris]|uniref:Phage tail assembly protein n=1 Tax=Vreelandella sulfidaeris TaxID=115553 RepID=A0A455U6B8_9GAMM|nr:hypothetical protein HSBAA_29780 [Halomonas sulfidaeris]
MAEILNLDDLNNVLKQFKFQGSVYDICEISLGDFIALTAEQKTMEAKSKAGGITEAELVESYRRNVMRMIPTITADVLDKMTMRQVKTLLDFINAAALEEQLDEDQAKK